MRRHIEIYLHRIIPFIKDATPSKICAEILLSIFTSLTHTNPKGKQRENPSLMKTRVCGHMDINWIHLNPS